jgi:DNA polymerase bacteriophage-type
MASFCLIDFETASACDLKKAGAWRYAEDPTTEVLCLGYTFGNEGTVLTEPDLRDPVARDILITAVQNPDVVFVAHNVAFEKAIWRNIMMVVYGWPDIPDERWHDIMAACALKGLPLKLERAVLALNLPAQKDTEGTKATLALGRLNKKGYYTRTPEKLQRVYDYNRSDLSAELGLHRVVKGLSAAERNVWLLDQQINQRGVRLDLAFIEAAQDVCDQATKPLLAEFRALTGIDKIMSPKFKDWLVEKGCPFPRDEDGKLDTSLSKENVLKLLGVEDDEADESLAGDDEDYQDQTRQVILPFAYRRPLEIRKVLGSASIKKLAAMQACVCSDGRAHGLLQYHGAGPGRWAGRLLQPQNFPRPTLKVLTGWKGDEPIYSGHDADTLVGAVMSRDAEFVRDMFGEPIEAVASGLRHCLVAVPGHTFEVGDFSKIECVIVLAIAGATDTAAAVIKAGSAVYCDMAQKIFGYPVTKHMLLEYTIGKNAILGCGFQMGWRKFKKRYWNAATDEAAKEAIRIYREDFAPEVPALWRALENAAVDTVWTGKPHEAYGIVYAMEDGWLTCRLHDGKKLYYRDATAVRKHMPWSTPEAPDIRRGFTYKAWKMGQWKTVHAYGGLLTENVVQATARQLLVNALFNCEREGHPVVLTVHDEAITEVPERLADAKLLDQYMTDVPQWAKQLRIPVASECWVGDRYRK